MQISALARNKSCSHSYASGEVHLPNIFLKLQIHKYPRKIKENDTKIVEICSETSWIEKCP